MDKTDPVINLESILIAPLQAKAEIRGAFSNEDEPEFAHLVKWFTTVAWVAQREKKSKTYLITHADVLVGYLNVTSITIEFQIPEAENQSAHDPQAVLVGKIYVAKNCRGKGIGKIAMAFAIDLANKMNELTGCAGVLVHANPNAVKFYEKLGFVYIENANDDRTMFLRLP